MIERAARNVTLTSGKILQGVIWFKIIFTFVLIALLCLVPAEGYKRLGMPVVPSSLFFVRLLGAAYIALVVGYIQAVYNLKAGKSAVEAVCVGIVSNGLAFIILLCYWVNGAWTNYQHPARIGFWTFTGAVGAITAGLIWAGLIKGGAKGV